MMSDKMNKILVVVLLTVLIWAWAFMSQEEEHDFTGTLEVSPSTDPSLLVTFTLGGSNPQTKIPLNPIVLKGTPTRIADLQKRYRLPLNHQDREQLNFFYNPQEQGRTTEGTFTLDLIEYLQKTNKIQEMVLTLESCEPKQVDVHIEQLENKKIPIQCVDEYGSEISGADPKPAFVNMYVRKGFNGSATAALTRQQIEVARKQPVSVRPYVNLGIAGVTRIAEEPVEVTIQSEELLRRRSFQTPRPVGILMSQKLQNAYSVTIVNEDELPSTFFILASDEAFNAYKKVDLPRYIIITESDVIDISQTRPKKIVYNFPSDYVRSGEIKADESRIAEDVYIKIEPR